MAAGLAARQTPEAWLSSAALALGEIRRCWDTEGAVGVAVLTGWSVSGAAESGCSARSVCWAGWACWAEGLAEGKAASGAAGSCGSAGPACWAEGGSLVLAGHSHWDRPDCVWW